MSKQVERLHTIRAHLRTGALGQREVWEDWLTEATEEIERLQAALQAMLTHFKQYEDAECCKRVIAQARRALEPKP